MTTVFVVWDGYYDAGEVDSVWLDRTKAETRADELRAKDYWRDKDGPNWEVLDMPISDSPESR